MTSVHKRRRLDQSHTFHISLDDLLLTQTSVAVIDKMSADGRRSLPQAYHVGQPTPPELFFDAFDFDREPYDQDPPLETEVVSTEDSTVSSERDLRTRYVSSVRNKFCLSSAWTHLFSRTTRCLIGHLIGANILMSFIFSMVFGGSAATGVPRAQFTPTKIHLFIAVKTVLSGSLYVACAACQPTCCTRCMWSRFFFCDAALLRLSFFFPALEQYLFRTHISQRLRTPSPAWPSHWQHLYQSSRKCQVILHSSREWCPRSRGQLLRLR